MDFIFVTNLSMCKIIQLRAIRYCIIYTVLYFDPPRRKEGKYLPTYINLKIIILTIFYKCICKWTQSRKTAIRNRN